MPLNKTQQDILESAIQNDNLNEINENLTPDKALTVLQLISAERITLSQESELKKWVISPSIEWKPGKWTKEITAWDNLQEIRRVIDHPAPQNRTTNNEYVFNFLNESISPEQEAALFQRSGVLSIEEYINGHAVYTTGKWNDSTKFEREPFGLFNLSGFNDSTAEPVTKEDVTDYISAKVNKRIEELQANGVVAAEILEVETVVNLNVQESHTPSNSAYNYLLSDSSSSASPPNIFVRREFTPGDFFTPYFLPNPGDSSTASLPSNPFPRSTSERAADEEFTISGHTAGVARSRGSSASSSSNSVHNYLLSDSSLTSEAEEAGGYTAQVARSRSGSRSSSTRDGM